MSGTNTITDADKLKIRTEIQEIQRGQRSLSGKFSKVKQRMRTMGMSNPQIKGFLRALQAKENDPDEAIEEEREYARMAALLRLPTEQMGLSLDDYEPDPKLDREVVASEAFDLGYSAGENGNPLEDNPYHQAEGSELFVAWRKGWDAGQASIAYRMADETTTPSAAPRPRGRPRRAAADASAEQADDGDGTKVH